MNCHGRLDDAIAQVEAHGGLILKPKHGIGPYGQIAVVRDSEGNRHRAAFAIGAYDVRLRKLTVVLLRVYEQRLHDAGLVRASEVPGPAALESCSGQLGHRLFRILPWRFRPIVLGAQKFDKFQLKIIQEIVTLTVFVGFALLYFQVDAALESCRGVSRAFCCRGGVCIRSRITRNF